MDLAHAAQTEFLTQKLGEFSGREGPIAEQTCHKPYSLLQVFMLEVVQRHFTEGFHLARYSDHTDPLEASFQCFLQRAQRVCPDVSGPRTSRNFGDARCHDAP